LRRLGWLLAGLLVVAAAAVALLPTIVRGPRFAWVVRRVLPPMLGQISIGGGRLGAGTVFALLTGRDFSIELDDLRVLDPEGTVVLASAHLSAQVAVHRDPARLVISDLRPGRATWRLGRMQHHRGIGFVAAFLAPARAGGRARGRAAPAEQPFVFQIANAELDGLDAAFDFPTWGLDLGNVKATGSLMADTRDPDHHVFGFEVHGIDARRGGTLRILDGTAAARLPFERALIRRVAITPQQQNDLQLDVEMAATGQSRLGGQATFGGVVGIAGAETRPGLTVAISLSSPAEALAALGVGTRLGPVSAVGSGGVIALRLGGPYEKLTATLTAHDLDLAYGGRSVGRAQLDAAAALGPLQADIRRLTLTAPGGGRIDVRGSLNQALDLLGDVQFHHVVTEGYLPPYLRRAGAGILDGEIQMKGGLASGAAAISRLDVTWERPAGTPSPRVIRLRSGQPGAGGPAAGLTVNAPGLGFSDGVLTLRRLSLPALGGRLSVDGQVRFWQGRPAKLLPSPQLTLEVRADGVDIDQAGLAPLISGRLGMAARVRGSLERLAVQVRVAPSSRLIILGDAYAASAPVDLRWQDNALTLSSLALAQPGGGGSRVELGGRIDARGEGDVHLTVADHDLFGLPGLRDAGLPMRGRFDARLRLQGRLNDPALSGEATIKDVTLNGQHLGGGTLTLEPAGHRGAHVRGTLFDAFSIDGVMVDTGGEPQVDLAVTLQQAKLDPLVPALPPLLSVGRATASGRVSMQIRSGCPVVFDAHFAELGLSYQLRAPLPSRAGRPARRVGIRSVGSVDAHMIGWGTELTLADAGFDFGAGALRASGTVKRGVLAARAHGPIDLGLLAPLFEAVAPGQIDRLSGQAEADVRLAGTLIAPRVQGTVGVVRAVEVGLRALPGARLNLTAGTLAFDEPDAVRLDGVAASLRYDDSASFTKAEASLRLDARLAQLRRPEGPSLSGELTVASAQVTSLALGDTVRVRDADVSVRDGTLTVPALEADSDHHGSLSIGANAAIVSTNPFVLGAVDITARGRGIAYGPESGLRIDELDLDLRLRGDARRSLTLSGDVGLDAGRFQVDAPKPPPATVGRAIGRAPARPRPPTLRDRVALDVRLRSDGQRFVIKHRFLPDLRVRLDLHAGGTVAAPKVSGNAGATDVYSWLALLLVRPFR
jgi:hypothetical protein